MKSSAEAPVKQTTSLEGRHEALVRCVRRIEAAARSMNDAGDKVWADALRGALDSYA